MNDSSASKIVLFLFGCAALAVAIWLQRCEALRAEPVFPNIIETQPIIKK
jgi:hypothetical protein